MKEYTPENIDMQEFDMTDEDNFVPEDIMPEDLIPEDFVPEYFDQEDQLPEDNTYTYDNTTSILPTDTDTSFHIEDLTETYSWSSIVSTSQTQGNQDDDDETTADDTSTTANKQPLPDYIEHPELLANDEHDPLLFAHLADLHLAPRTAKIEKRDPKTHRLIRDLDMSNALHLAVNDILSQRPLPSACVIAGDIFDTFQGSQEAMIDASREFKRLRLANIVIVAIAGNHDTPTQKLKTPLYVGLQHEFNMIAGDMDAHFAYDQIEHVKVGDVEYVLLPHLAAMSGEFTKEDFTPCLGASKSVLIVHGVAAGDPSLQQQDENKEIPIARWIMEMDWDYVAFGHYHKPGWVPGYRGKAAYCGSLENTVISGPDVCMSRGPVYIDLSKSGEDMLVMHPQKIRPIMDLPVIDLKDREITADELDSEIVALILGNDTDEAIVTHKVVNIPRSLYKSLTRRSFQNVNPSMLYIQTKFEQATETKQVTLTVTNDEGEEVEKVVTVDENGVEVNPEQAFQPLAKEAETMLDAMIMEGNIQASKKDEIMKLINSYLEN